MKQLTRRCLIATLMAISALALAACGEKQEAVSGAGSAAPFTLMLDWVPNADHVGIYEAMHDGAFAQAGLNVHLQVPTDPATPLQLLAQGKVDAAISYEPEVMLARDKGLALVSVAAIVQKPLTSIISLPSKHVNIRTPQALRGKTVGDAGIAYQQAYLQTILAGAGVPASKVKSVNVGANLVPAMLSGRVDATLGGYWNYEAIQLRQRGKHPNVIRVDRVGVPTYDELVLVMRRSTIEKQPDIVRRFVQAIGRGYSAVKRNPSAGIDALVQANPGLDPKLQTASVHATLPVFFPSQSGRPWGWQNPTEWNAYGQWMLSHHLISHPTAFAGALTNELLAGQGV
jgi:putative hydroxymethylpyrimidine transport system substrate-binding protein